MSADSEERYWQSQMDLHGPGSLPSDFAEHPAQVQAAEEWNAQQEAQAAPQYEQPAYEAQPEELYDPAMEYLEPPDPFSDNYAGELEQYLDARDQQSGFGAEVDYSDPYSSQEAWHAANAAQQEAQAQLNAHDSEQQFQQALPGHIENALGHRAGADEAAQMLAPAVRELAEHTAQGLLAGLVAEGYSHEEAVGILSHSQDALYKASTDSVREAYGSQQALNEMRAGFRGGS